MKKNSKSEVVLTACQLQATRLNKLEHRRLERNVNLLHNDLQDNLARLQRQAQGLRYHYTNVVRVVKPNRGYESWKQAHAYEIAQDETKIWLESMKFKQKSKSKVRQPIPLTTEKPSEPMPPLLLLVENNIEKPIEPIINLTENTLRPKTSPVNKYAPNQHRINPLLTMLDEHSINSNNSIRTQQSESSSISILPSIIPSNSRKLVQGKLITTQKPANLDALYRIALQNQTAYQSVERTRITERKLVDKEFASQHRALKGNMRSTGLVK